jgi:sucrose-6-phosphate hydrolase SacC (GH32 family)
VSNELVFWTRLPVALSPGPEPYDSGGIWSGSVSIDPITRTPTIFYTGNTPCTRTCAPHTHTHRTHAPHRHTRALHTRTSFSGSRRPVPGVSPQVQCVAYPADMSDPLLTHWNKSTSNPFLRSTPATFPQDNFRDPTTAW